MQCMAAVVAVFDAVKAFRHADVTKYHCRSEISLVVAAVLLAPFRLSMEVLVEDCFIGNCRQIGQSISIRCLQRHDHH